MNYTNHSSRAQLGAHTDRVQKRPTFLSLESDRRGTRLCVRTAATLARRKGEAVKLAVAAIAVAASFVAADHAQAQLGYDPFAGNLSHAEESWASYSDASLNGTNRPTSTAINGVNGMLANAASFNFDVTAPANENAFITGGHIYSFADQLTLTLTSTYAPVVGSFNTVVFSIHTLGNPLNTVGVLLTPNGGQAITPVFTNVTTSGSGMGAQAQYAFQFDLSGIGGSNNFTIAVPGSATSVSFAASQLDATTTAYGRQDVVPEPTSLTFAALAVGAGSLWWRARRRSVNSLRVAA